MIPDGQPHPVPDFPGLSAVCVRPDDRTLRAEVRREDGSIAGQGLFVAAMLLLNAHTWSVWIATAGVSLASM